MAIQCQYKQESDSNDKTCTTAVIDCALYVCLMSTDGTDNDMSKYDIYFWDIKHFLSTGSNRRRPTFFQEIINNVWYILIIEMHFL